MLVLSPKKKSDIQWSAGECGVCYLWTSLKFQQVSSWTQKGPTLHVSRPIMPGEFPFLQNFSKVEQVKSPHCRNDHPAIDQDGFHGLHRFHLCCNDADFLLLQWTLKLPGAASQPTFLHFLVMISKTALENHGMKTAMSEDMTFIIYYLYTYHICIYYLYNHLYCIIIYVYI